LQWMKMSTVGGGSSSCVMAMKCLDVCRLMTAVVVIRIGINFHFTCCTKGHRNRAMQMEETANK
jgi:hypothetical protein